MSESLHKSTEELTAGLEEIGRAPREAGVLKLIVRRPVTDQREVLDEGELSVADGLVGDGWKSRAGAAPRIETQLTIMSARAADLVAGRKERWPLAGDQLFIDMDLSDDSLPPGTRLAIGTAVIEITPEPHTGCHKFRQRYGLAALKFVNSPEGKALHLRGIYAKVIQAGTIHSGDVVRRVE